PVTTADVRYTFERLLAPGMHSPAARFFADLVGAQAYQQGVRPTIRGIVISRHGVSFHLKSGDPSFVTRIAPTYACPVRQGTPVSDQGAAILRSQATGPYRIAEASPSRVVLTRNPRYAVQSLGPRGYADRIVLTAGADPARLLAGVRSGR